LELNVGIIGAGLIGTTHLFSLKIIIDENLLAKYNVKVKITGIAEKDEKRLLKLKKNNPYNTEFFTSKADELIKNKKIDIVYIATPTKFHKEQFIKAAQNGKHIFCEKPLAFSIHDINEMMIAAKDNHILSQVGLVLRHCPVFWKIKKIISEKKNELGSHLCFTFRDAQEWPIGTRSHPSKWRKNPEIAHAGCLYEHSIHDIDMIEYLFGENSNLSNISAKIRYVSSLTMDKLEDVALVSFKYKDDLIGNLASTWNFAKKDDRRLEIFFENGWIVLTGYKVYAFDYFGGLLKRKRFDFLMEEIISEYQKEKDYPQFRPTTSAYMFENLSFLESIVLEKEPYPSLEIGLKAHEIVEGAYLSSKSDKKIEF
jgi:myo-inositol 2-dehydrogenase/D-chiro-inositol 1-dehydrogenase